MNEASTLTPEIILVLGLLFLTVYLFVSEIVRIDVAAVSIMVALGLTTMLPGLTPIIDSTELFEGFSSNAVMSIIAVMIIGAGLDKTGIMSRVANWILKKGGSTESRITPLISGTVGLISSFMQNVGAAALFLPVVSRISRRTSIPMSRLLMPMGFCAILGGTVTMVGSSPLILLNDLMLSSNKALPAEHQMRTFGLFDVTPIGLALIATGILFFTAFGRFVLPNVKSEKKPESTTRTAEYFQRVYGITGELFELQATLDSPLVGMTIMQIERTLENVPFVLAVRNGDEIAVVPDGKDVIWVNSYIGVLSNKRQLVKFARQYKLRIVKGENHFSNVMNAQETGIAEIVVPPGSSLVGQTLNDLQLRRNDGLHILRIYRAGYTVDEKVRDTPLQGGDTLVAHTSWRNLKLLRDNKDYAIVTDHVDEELRPNKIRHALFFFILAVSLVLFSELRLSVSLLVGAVGMVLAGVLTMDEAYHAVSWKTVFLLASLIPLGLAVEKSGAAAWIAMHTLQILGDVPIWLLQAVIAILSTIFTLVMSNIGATVLLVPLAINIAVGAGADPAVFALTVAIATSNSFIIPTHQVNALIMGPAGYRVIDFMRAGTIMSVLFLIVSLTMLNLIF